MATSSSALLGRPHYELVEQYGYHESLIGRYADLETAESERDLRLRMWTKIRLSHGTLIIRKVDY